MKKTLLLVFAFVLGLPAWSQVQLGSPMGDIPGELKGIERRFTNALIFGDVKTLEEVLDDTFLDTDEDGHQLDKAGFIKAIKSGDRKILSISLSQLKIRSYVYAAIVAGRATQKGMSNGQAIPETASFTDVFAMINGQWKIVASHRSGIATPPAPAPPAASKK